MTRFWAAVVALALVGAACSSSGDTDLSTDAVSSSADPDVGVDSEAETGASEVGGGAPTPTEPTTAPTPEPETSTPTALPSPTEPPTPQPEETATPEPDEDPWGPTPTPGPVVVENGHPISGGVPCVLQLHGNAGTGIDAESMINGPYFASGAITLLQPISPDATDTDTFWEFDGPYEEYSDSEVFYERIRDFLRDHVDTYGCGPIFVWGASAGAAMAIELYCNGEDFGGRVWAYFFADPAMGASVRGCTPPPYTGMRTWLVQSHEVIDQAVWWIENEDGWCGTGPTGYYCEDGIALGPEEYYAELGIRPDAIVDTHLEALFGADVETDAWTNIETWYAEYDPSRF